MDERRASDVRALRGDDRAALVDRTLFLRAAADHLGT
jgi:hypothetical protein